MKKSTQIALAAALTTVVAAHLVQRHRRQRTAQAEPTQWDQRWLAVLPEANRPVYQGKLELPEHAPTHIKAVFQIAPGSDFEVYADCASRLASTLGPDMVLVEPMPMVGTDGTPVVGTIQALGS